MRNLFRLTVILGLAALAACSTLSVGTVARLRALDLINDDIAELVLALDVPVALVPQPDKSRFVLSATKADGTSIRTEVMLVRADAQEMAEHLPPPAQDRGYYLFGFADADKQRLRDTQAELRDLRASGAQASVDVSLNISFCILAEIDPAATTFSAHIALPGADRLEPLISEETIANLVANTGQGTLEPCGNFSN